MAQRPQQLPDGAADQGISVPRPGGLEDVGTVQKLGGVFGDESRLPGRLNQPLEQVPLKPSLKQLAAKAAQNSRVETRLFECETKAMLSSQVEAHALLGLCVGAIVVVFEEHGEHDHRGRYGWPTFR